MSRLHPHLVTDCILSVSSPASFFSPNYFVYLYRVLLCLSWSMMSCPVSVVTEPFIFPVSLFGFWLCPWFPHFALCLFLCMFVDQPTFLCLWPHFCVPYWIGLSVLINFSCTCILPQSAISWWRQLNLIVNLLVITFWSLQQKQLHKKKVFNSYCSCGLDVNTLNLKQKTCTLTSY